MPNWLEGMLGPTLLLWVYALAVSVSWVAASGRGGLSGAADLISRWAMALVIANWVIRDARKRGRPLCYDYGMFLFFAWPIVAPVYLFQTRGVRAFPHVVVVHCDLVGCGDRDRHGVVGGGSVVTAAAVS